MIWKFLVDFKYAFVLVFQLEDRLSVREFEIAEKNEVIQTIQEVFNNNPETSTLNIKIFGGCYAYKDMTM